MISVNLLKKTRTKFPEYKNVFWYGGKELRHKYVQFNVIRKLSIGTAHSVAMQAFINPLAGYVVSGDILVAIKVFVIRYYFRRTYVFCRIRGTWPGGTAYFFRANFDTIRCGITRHIEKEIRVVTGCGCISVERHFHCSVVVSAATVSA